MADSTRLLVERLARRLHAEVIETHISWVLLVPGFAYKLKKPVRLPFLDYSTPQQRAHFCAEEVRLNRRLAPSLYLGVAHVTGSPESPAFDGPGHVLDDAVKMRRFAAGALFSEQARAGTLTAAQVDRLAERIAAFQAEAPAAHPGPAHAGEPLRARALAALAGCEDLCSPADAAQLRAWIEREATATVPFWEARRAAGCVREGHGDLHLANVVALEGDVAAFDCIEFDAGLRWIDVIGEVAFTLMDFVAHGQAALGWRFFNGWLERTGDYDGVRGLRLCLVYRALVRALVHHLRTPGGERAHVYLREALAWSRPAAPRLFITHGLPGSGKTFQSQQVLERHGAIRIRSDVERKRLAGLDRLARSQEAGLDLYTPDATERTYARLFALARVVLAAGFPVVLDAAFLRHGERLQAWRVAQELQVPFSIVACKAPLPVLRERLHQRRGDASEADLAVLDKLRASEEPLREEEWAFLYLPPAAAL